MESFLFVPVFCTSEINSGGGGGLAMRATAFYTSFRVANITHPGESVSHMKVYYIPD